LSEFWNSVKEYDNLRLAFNFGNFLQNIENDLILVWTTTIEVIDSNQSFVLIFRIKFYKIVANQVILNKLSEIIFISCSWSDKKLSYELLTLAVEVFTVGLASSLSMLLNYPRVSSFTLSHSSNMTHFSYVRSKLLLLSFSCIFFGNPTIMCPFSKIVLYILPILIFHL
jgi:hypothetical protein